MFRFSIHCLLIALTFAESAALAATGGTINVYFHVIRRGAGIAAASDGSVLMPGDKALVEAWAHPPAEAYAFASADFEVEAEPGLSGWTVVSDGNIAGAQVQEITVSQPHNSADPSNPLRIWSGVYEPVCYDLRLVRVQATPSEFAYYPSETASAPIECDADGGSRSLLINPITVGQTLVAPGEGTTIESGAGLDILIANTGGDRYEIEWGFVTPVNSTVRIAPENPPTQMTLETELNEGGTAEIMFVEVAGGYEMQPHWSLADGYEYRVHRSGFAGQTVRIRIEAADASTASLSLDRLPTIYSSRIQLDGRADQTRVIRKMCFDDAARVITPDGRVFIAESIEVHALRDGHETITMGAQTVQVHGGGQGAGKVVFQDLCCM